VQESEGERLVITKVDASRPVPDVHYCLIVMADFTWKIYVHGKEVPQTLCQWIANIPTALDTVQYVPHALSRLDGSYICKGNGDTKFQQTKTCSPPN